MALEAGTRLGHSLNRDVAWLRDAREHHFLVVELSRGSDAFETVSIGEIGLVEHGPYREICVVPVGAGSP